jgi:hypothetical protein
MDLTISYTITSGCTLYFNNFDKQHDLAILEFFPFPFNCTDAINLISSSNPLHKMNALCWGLCVPLQAKIFEATEWIQMKFGIVRLRW